MSENAKLSGTDLEPAELAALHERFDAVTEAMTRMERRLEALQAERQHSSGDFTRILLRQQSLAAAIDRIEAALRCK